MAFPCGSGFCKGGPLFAFLTGRNFTTGYGYDAASNRTSFTDPESGSTAYVYDTLNRLQTLTPPAAIRSQVKRNMNCQPPNGGRDANLDGKYDVYVRGTLTEEMT